MAGGDGGGPVVAVVQARTGSSRFPGKVLAPLEGRPLLAVLLQRLSVCSSLDAVVVATSDRPGDDAVADLARSRGCATWRGSEADVLGRLAGAARAAGAATVVRITADCPLLGPEAVDAVVAAHLLGRAAPAGPPDLTTNAPPRGRTWPDGLDVEVLDRAVLDELDARVAAPELREHVTLALHRERGRRVRVVHLDPAAAGGARDLGGARITVDVPADLERVQDLLARLRATGRGTGVLDVLAALAAEAGGRAGAQHLSRRPGP